MLNETFSVIFKHRAGLISLLTSCVWLFRISIGFDTSSSETPKVENGLLHQPNLILHNHVNPYQNSKLRSSLSPQGHHGEYVIPRQMWDIFAKSFMSGKTGLEEGKMASTIVSNEVENHSKNESITTVATTTSLKSSTNEAKNVSTVFENHRKSLIQHCEQSELRLHFEWTKVD